MRLVHGITIAAALALLTPNLGAIAQDTSKGVAGGGITVAGWTGKIDDSKENTGLTLKDAKFAAMGGGCPAVRWSGGT